MARILLVDDDTSLCDVLAMAFEDAGHEVLTAGDGRQGLERCLAELPALLVSDINMPHMDGFTLCRRLRELGNPVPIVLLTSRDSEIDEALGLDLGADDFITKPFSTRVLLSRVGALLRREAMRRQAPTAPPVRVVGLLHLDQERLELHYGDVEIPVTVSEFRLVHALAERPGVVLGRERLLERVRGDDSVVAERLIDTYVRRLRRKFEVVDPAFDEIETVVGAGYRWRG